MKSIQLPQITRDRILSVEVGEECSFIVPIAESISFQEENEGISMIVEKSCTMNLECVGDFSKKEFALKYLIGNHSPLHQQDRFFIAEEILEKTTILESKPECIETIIDASIMTPEQSRLHGVVVDIRVEKIIDVIDDAIEFMVQYKLLVSQHNELNNTNIEPSPDDYVFYLTVKRIK